MTWTLNDYREVPERIAEWYQRYPDGRIVCKIVEFTDIRVTVKASAYRGPGEEPAGVGHSFLTIPGKTTFTKDSELENAETSAAGRALVMAGIPAKTVASEQEKQSKSSSDVEPAPSRVTLGSPGGGMAEEDGSGAPASGPVSEESAAYGEGAAGSSDRPEGDAPPAEGAGEHSQSVPDAGAPSSVEQRKDFRAYLAERYSTADALMMARALFQTQVRKVPNMTVLDLDELQAVDVELKARKLEAS